MDIDNQPSTVTVTLTRAEANTLRVELMDLDPDRIASPTLIQGLIEGMAQPVSRGQAADAIMEASEFRRERARRYRETDPGMAKMFDDDAEDLRHIARQVRQGLTVAAVNATAMLDTAVREDIPECAWPFVGLRPLR